MGPPLPLLEYKPKSFLLEPAAAGGLYVLVLTADEPASMPTTPCVVAAGTLLPFTC